MSLKRAQKAVEQAQAAYSANPEKHLKKALKAAKAALAAEEANQAPQSSKKRKGEEPSAEAPTETPKKAKKAKKSKGEKDVAQEIDTLTAAVANAKTAYKADKTKDNKKKLKAAKAALAEFQAANAPAAVAVSTPAAVAVSAPAPSAPSDLLAQLKSNKPQADAAATDGKKCAPIYDPCNRVFVAKLRMDVDDDGIKQFFEDCGTITKINWIEDKETKAFKGCGVLDFETLEAAQKAVAKHDQLFMGRNIAVQYSQARRPRGTGTPLVDEKQQRFLATPLAPKPAGCLTCFVGNLSFKIEEDDVRQFAEECGEVTGIRWLYRKDTGDFKGCGFVEFADTEAVDKFVAKRGTLLAGRPVHIEYSKTDKNERRQA